MIESSAAPPLAGPAQENGTLPEIAPFNEGVVGQWDSFVQAHPKGTFFHQAGWKRVMEKTYGYRAYYFYTHRAGQITGIAPAFLISNWITGRCLISIPFAVYGGICAVDAESERKLLGHLEQLARDLRVEYLELRNRNGGLMPGYHANPRYATFTVPVVAETKAMYDGFPKDIRYMIRKGEKAGLKARGGFDQLDSFYRLMTINLRRLGTPTFPRALFENLIREYPGQVDLTLVYAENQPVAGGMSFFFRDWMQPYYIGSMEEAKTLAANNFLWWELIKIASERGLRTFDFGRSKKESGNYAFKAKWNPRIEPLDYQVRLVGRNDVPNFNPTNSKFELAMNLWKKVPLGLTRAIGPRLVRWFP
ncbi:MAG: FemAB family PEP-CTERM system-associated protein [Acidobacteriia bacterium]|nr:FemAB family PEP-CTERM system-associated protein [Terriglobia bacterium]